MRHHYEGPAAAKQLCINLICFKPDLNSVKRLVQMAIRCASDLPLLMLHLFSSLLPQSTTYHCVRCAERKACTPLSIFSRQPNTSSIAHMPAAQHSSLCAHPGFFKLLSNTVSARWASSSPVSRQRTQSSVPCTIAAHYAHQQRDAGQLYTNNSSTMCTAATCWS
jgi:hypothetical protein